MRDTVLKESGEMNAKRLASVPGRMVWTMVDTLTLVASRASWTLDVGNPGFCTRREALSDMPAMMAEPLKERRGSFGGDVLKSTVAATAKPENTSKQAEAIKKVGCPEPLL